MANKDYFLGHLRRSTVRYPVSTGINTRSKAGFAEVTTFYTYPELTPGTATSDSIPALLSNGEYVLPAAAVRAIGVPTLEQLRMGALRQSAQGGARMAGAQSEAKPMGT